MAVEARYVGTRSLQSWQTYNYNETNIVENGFLNEFRLAQQNLQANVAAGLRRHCNACTFAYRGTGHEPAADLPRVLQRIAADVNSVSALLPAANWTSATFQAFLATRNPNPYGMVTNGDNTGLINNATRRQIALNAGLPANFLVANPDYLGGAEIIGNGGYTKYNSLQLELRKRLSHGLSVQQPTTCSARRTSRSATRCARLGRRSNSRATDGGVTHALKANWTYELPFGQGRRFGGDASGFVDRLDRRLVVRRHRHGSRAAVCSTSATSAWSA